MHNDRAELNGRIVVVTGAASGIGLATAEAFAVRGARVFGLDRNVGPDASGVEWVIADLADPESVATAFAEIAELADHLDVLVNNAGIGVIGTVEEATEEEWLRVFGVNVFGAARASKHALPLLRGSDAGAIIHVSSIAALVGTPVRAVYSATKGAIDALTRAMAADLLTDRIRVNVVYPGTVDTPFTGRLDADPAAARQLLIDRQPMGRLIDSAEIARAILFLASPHNLNVTGTGLRVDGGMTRLINLGTA